MDVFDLFARIGLDTSEYEKGLAQAKKSNAEYKSDVMKLAQTYKAQGMNMSDAMKKAYSEIDKSQYETAENSKKDAKEFLDNWSNAASSLKNVFANVAKVGTVAIGAAATGVAAITKSAVENFAQYEQLVGGVETLFKDSADVVQEYAANAYKTAGLSANEYMETVTSFSASLLQSLGGDTAKAAETADKAITDMSDNVAKMGTSMESIQYAYQGFARGSFVMLDNLKLGYSGSQEEMQRLLDDANEYNRQQGINTNYQIQNYADIVEAIHVVQTEIGITGTTAKEAASTIEGSLASAKSAWQNLLTGIADENADFETLIDNFVDSASTAFDNLLPRIEMSLAGVGKLVSELAPVIADTIPALVDDVLPSILQAAVDLVGAFGDAILTNGGTIANTALDILDMLVNTLVDNAYSIADGAAALVTTLISGISERLPDLIPAAVRIILEVSKGLLDNTGALIAAAGNLVISIGSGMIEAIPDILYAPVAICTSIADSLANYDWSTAAATMMNKLIDALDTAQKKVQVWLDNTFSGGKLYGGDIANVESSDFVKNMRDGTDIIVSEIAKSQEEIQTYYNDGKEIIGTAQDELNENLKGNATRFEEQSKKNSDVITKAITNSAQNVTAAQKNASNDIKSTYDKLAETEKKAAQKAAEETKKNFKSILDTYDQQLKDVQNKIDSFSQKLTGAYKDFYSFETDEEGNITGAYATDKMKQEQQKLQQYYDLLLDFTERGVGTDMIGQLADVSQEEGLAMLQYWDSLTDEQLHALQANYDKVVNMSSKVSELIYSEKSKEVADDVVSQITAAVQDDPQFKAVGEMMLSGIISGLNSGQFDITEAADRIYSAFGNYFETGTVSTGSTAPTTYKTPAESITVTRGGAETMPTENASPSINGNSDLSVEINIESFNNYTTEDIDTLTDRILISLQDKINKRRVAFS